MSSVLFSLFLLVLRLLLVFTFKTVWLELLRAFCRLKDMLRAVITERRHFLLLQIVASSSSSLRLTNNVRPHAQLHRRRLGDHHAAARPFLHVLLVEEHRAAYVRRAVRRSNPIGMCRPAGSERTGRCGRSCFQLSIKNSDSAKKLESIDSRKRELEEEKLTIQRQMEKKDSEINDLNTKLNERNAELQSLKSDKTALDEQLVRPVNECAPLANACPLFDRLERFQIHERHTGGERRTDCEITTTIRRSKTCVNIACRPRTHTPTHLFQNPERTN